MTTRLLGFAGLILFFVQLIDFLVTENPMLSIPVIRSYVPVDTIGFVCLLAGVGLYTWGFLTRYKTWAPAGTDPQTIKGHSLCSSGPYAIVRHPLYAGLLLSFLGAEIVYTSALALIVLPVILIDWIVLMKEEESHMRAKYTNEYDAYCASVRYRLVPFFY
jgi:protein-S-isoprenylcysteine O-methyltransferase Ste14